MDQHFGTSSNPRDSTSFRMPTAGSMSMPRLRPMGMTYEQTGAYTPRYDPMYYENEVSRLQTEISRLERQLNNVE